MTLWSDSDQSLLQKKWVLCTYLWLAEFAKLCCPLLESTYSRAPRLFEVSRCHPGRAKFVVGLSKFGIADQSYFCHSWFSLIFTDSLSSLDVPNGGKRNDASLATVAEMPLQYSFVVRPKRFKSMMSCCTTINGLLEYLSWGWSTNVRGIEEYVRGSLLSFEMFAGSVGISKGR